MKSASLIVISALLFLCISLCYADDISTLLRDGKMAIEGGQYEKAVNYLGKILDASGNQTNDDKIVAFGATVQAYGIWKLNNPQMNPMIIEYLNKAIARDPSWEYPKKFLKEVESKKESLNSESRLGFTNN